MPYAAGVDVGSTQTKAVIINEAREIVGRALMDTGANVAELGEVVGLDELVERDGTLWQKDSPVYVRGKPIGRWEEQ